MPEVDASDTPLHVGAEEWLRRSASRGEIYARHDSRMRRTDRAETEPAEPVRLPSVRWPEPTAALMTACEVLSWIAFGDIRELDARIDELDARIDLGEAYRWGHTRLDRTMAAIHAIIADSWEPDPPDSPHAPHPAWAADGRAWIEAVRARVEHQDGVPISLPRLGELLADHIEWHRQARARLNRAEHELLEALRGGSSGRTAATGAVSTRRYQSPFSWIAALV